MNGDGHTIADITVRNNIFYRNTNEDTASSYPRRSCIKKDDAMNSTLVIDRNLYWAAEPGCWILRTDGGSREHIRRNGWSGYMALGRFDQSSPSPADPLVVDPAANDFRLQAGSPVINAGTNLFLFMDYDGTRIPAASPYLGACESGY